MGEKANLQLIQGGAGNGVVEAPFQDLAVMEQAPAEAQVTPAADESQPGAPNPNYRQELYDQAVGDVASKYGMTSSDFTEAAAAEQGDLFVYEAEEAANKAVADYDNEVNAEISRRAGERLAQELAAMTPAERAAKVDSVLAESDAIGRDAMTFTWGNHSEALSETPAQPSAPAPVQAAPRRAENLGDVQRGMRPGQPVGAPNAAPATTTPVEVTPVSQPSPRHALGADSYSWPAFGDTSGTTPSGTITNLNGFRAGAEWAHQRYARERQVTAERQAAALTAEAAAATIAAPAPIAVDHLHSTGEHIAVTAPESAVQPPASRPHLHLSRAEREQLAVLDPGNPTPPTPRAVTPASVEAPNYDWANEPTAQQPVVAGAAATEQIQLPSDEEYGATAKEDNAAREVALEDSRARKVWNGVRHPFKAASGAKRRFQEHWSAKPKKLPEGEYLEGYDRSDDPNVEVIGHPDEGHYVESSAVALPRGGMSKGAYRRTMKNYFGGEMKDKPTKEERAAAVANGAIRYEDGGIRGKVEWVDTNGAPLPQTPEQRDAAVRREIDQEVASDTDLHMAIARQIRAEVPRLQGETNEQYNARITPEFRNRVNRVYFRRTLDEGVALRRPARVRDALRLQHGNQFVSEYPEDPDGRFWMDPLPANPPRPRSHRPTRTRRPSL